MARTASIGIRVEPALKAAMEAAANADHRPVASLIEKVMIDWLETNGYKVEATGTPSAKRKTSDAAEAPAGKPGQTEPPEGQTSG